MSMTDKDREDLEQAKFRAQFFQPEYDADWYSWWNDFKDNDPRYWSKDMAEIFHEWRFPKVHFGGLTRAVPLDEYIWPTEKERTDWYKKVMGEAAPAGPNSADQKVNKLFAFEN